MLCLGQPSVVTLESCGPNDLRTQSSERVWLVEAAAGRTVYEETVAGLAPTECAGTSWLHEGKAPARAEIDAFLQRALAGG